MSDIRKSWTFLNADSCGIGGNDLPMLAWKLYKLRGVAVLEISASKELDTQPYPALHGLISILNGQIEGRSCDTTISAGSGNSRQQY
jgi:hypothetical protein